MNTKDKLKLIDCSITTVNQIRGALERLNENSSAGRMLKDAVANLENLRAALLEDDSRPASLKVEWTTVVPSVPGIYTVTFPNDPVEYPCEVSRGVTRVCGLLLGMIRGPARFKLVAGNYDFRPTAE